MYCIIIYLSFLNCDWLLIQEVEWFYWTQKLLVPIKKFTVRMPILRLELATPGLQIQCSSHWATRARKLLLGRSWVYPVGVLHYYIFIILNSDWLLIWEVELFCFTQKLLVPVEKFTVRMPMLRLELATPGLQTQCSSHWATRARKLLLGRSRVYPVGVLHHYIFIISQLLLSSHPRSRVVLLDTETPGTSREVYSEDTDGETRPLNP